jgi:hypothetical protein
LDSGVRGETEDKSQEYLLGATVHDHGPALCGIAEDNGPALFGTEREEDPVLSSFAQDLLTNSTQKKFDEKKPVVENLVEGK